LRGRALLLPRDRESSESDGAVAIGGGTARSLSGRVGHILTCARPRKTCPRASKASAARGPRLLATAVVRARVTHTSVVSSGCASAAAPVTDSHRCTKGSIGGPWRAGWSRPMQRGRDGAPPRRHGRPPCPMCALVGGPWSRAGFSLVSSPLSRRFFVCGAGRHRTGRRSCAIIISGCLV
jgi:hypothetical protein